MTQKELLYLEDSIGHEDNIIKMSQESLNLIEDKNLISFMEQEISKHTQMKEKLISMLEVKANE